MLKRISVDDVALGMFLHGVCGSWMEHPFWKVKFTLTDPADLRRLRDSGVAEVWIDTDRGRDVPGGVTQDEADRQVERELEAAIAAVAPTDAALPPAPAPAGAAAAPDNEFLRAAELRDQALTKMRSLFSEARMGRVLQVEACAQTVQDIIHSMGRHKGALISLLRLKSQDEYTYLHSIAVCALMVGLGRTLDFDDEQLALVGMAGMLHDIGKAQIPLRILHKPGRLSDEEFALIKMHPRLGFDLLAAAPGVSAWAKEVCLSHHEKVDGSGYPRGLRGEAISPLARMGAVCDVYDAITSARPYKDAWAPGEAVRQMAQWKGHFDSRMLQAFIKTVGIYPIGTLVRLRSQRLAVVCEQNEASLLKPTVRLLMCATTRRRLAADVIDLATDVDDAVLGVENAAVWGLRHLDRLWQDVAMTV